FQTDDLDAFDSDCDDAPLAKAVLMSNLSLFDSDVLSKVPFYDANIENDMSYQSVQETQCFEQPSFDNNIEVDITSAYLDPKQLAFLADNRDIVIPAQSSQEFPSPVAFQTDDLDAFDSDCDDAPLAKAVLMANLSFFDLDVLSETIEIDITNDSDIISYEQYLQEIETPVVQSTSSSTQQDELLMSVIGEMSTQVAKSLGYQNPFYLSQARWKVPALYDGNTIVKTRVAFSVIDTEETIEFAEESRLKMRAKQDDPSLMKHKVNLKPIEYVALNKLSKHFVKHFVPQKQLSAEQAYWLPILQLVVVKPQIPSEPILKKEIPRELPSISLVSNDSTCSKSYLENVKLLKSHNEPLLKDLKKSELIVLGYKTGLGLVEERLKFLKTNESTYLEDIKVLKVEIQLKEIAIRELRKKLKIAQKEKDSIQLNVETIKNASKSLNKLIECQIVDNCKKGLWYENSNTVSPLYTGNFIPPTPDLSFTRIDEFVNNPKAKNYKAKSSEEETKAVRKNDDAPIINEWASDNEKENESQHKLKRK
nr:hypothetical protein [Tanacetum cinerariifolium]